MDYIVPVYGYCPEQDCEYFVDITYHHIITTGLNGYKKGVNHCEYKARNSCSEKLCPIVKNAPENPE
ncbi:MAG: hypothetical protein LKE46_01900 [Clostridium sp.]|jgi:hypothetical protein|uniref:hypothetical protein n=1 Tax=Clostridium sp. TaxID=1506 RepID=UPI0025BFC939|nr:hypothetical protein [Clostridium sp.]MCH3963004.1 hypothetical protein [Clostridium sp.]MCI1800213.1 hypothetical protein [Clostridium sp.]MCI2202083.1 hypothetical protein [Clostridium sp.]